MTAPEGFPEDAGGSITGLYQQWRAGHSGSLSELINRFRPRLLALARSTLAGRVQRVADAEDALQSAIISFWEGVDQGTFKDVPDRDDLWNVLGLITVRKALRLQERERAQKRGGGKVVSGFVMETVSSPSAGENPELLCTELLELLDDDIRSFALLKLLGNKNREIAEQLNCSERKVERKLHLVKAIWENEMAAWNS